MPIDLSSIQAAFGSLQVAGQIGRALVDVRDADLVRDKSRELVDAIISAQTNTLAAQGQLSSAIEEIRQLRQQLEDMEAWNAERNRYEMKELGPGRFVYALKESSRGE